MNSGTHPMINRMSYTKYDTFAAGSANIDWTNSTIAWSGTQYASGNKIELAFYNASGLSSATIANPGFETGTFASGTDWLRWRRGRLP